MEEPTEYGEITGDKLKNEVIDSFISQYLLMLDESEFEILGLEGIETYPSWNRNLLYIYFLVGTFLTLVVFFNVLIAIISEQYADR